MADKSGLGSDPRYGIRIIYNGMRTRGWQIIRDGLPISFLFDEYDDAEAALREFQAEDIAVEANPHQEQSE